MFQRSMGPRTAVTHLQEATDQHFVWLLGEIAPPGGLTAPSDGVDGKAVLSVIRHLVASLHSAGCRSHWLIVDGSEVVGLCGFKRPPDASGMAEIGYGVAVSRRGKGFATHAVALMLDKARDIEGVLGFTAETAEDNLASQVALERNGFSRTGRRHDAEDGDLIQWRKAVSV